MFFFFLAIRLKHTSKTKDNEANENARITNHMDGKAKLYLSTL